MQTLKTNIFKAVIGLAVIAGCATAAVAQNTESGYFNDEYMYRYQMNPAIGNDHGFVAMPGLGNLDVSMTGTMHVKDYIYNVGGRTTTFMNPGVSASEFLSKVKDKNRLYLDLRETVLAFGFKAFNGYNTLTVSARANVGLHLPGSLFRLLKEGPANRSYDISDLGATATGWAEVALNHSHNIGDRLRVGATLKALVGAGHAEAQLDRANLTLGTDSWNIEAQGDIKASLKGLQYERDYNEDTQRYYVSGAKVDGAGVGGFGFGVDLGAMYRVTDDITVSLSVTDLGMINWSNQMLATTQGLQTVQTSDYTFNIDGDAANSFDNEFKKMRNKLSRIYQLHDAGDQGSCTTAMAPTIHVGGEYVMPFYNKLTAGLLCTMHMQGDYSWTNVRVSANVAPCKLFSAGVNVGMGTFGASFGWIVNLHCPGFNLFVAEDQMLGKVSKQFVPLSSNASVNVGLNFPF